MFSLCNLRSFHLVLRNALANIGDFLIDFEASFSYAQCAPERVLAIQDQPERSAFTWIIACGEGMGVSICKFGLASFHNMV